MVNFAKLLLRIILKIFFRADLRNMGNVPKNGPILLCSNHISLFDMLFIGYKLKRNIHWMAKEELFRVPVLGWFITKAGAFPVKRGKGDVDSIKTAIKLLDEGHIVGIFPQGTRIGNKDWRTFRAKRGAALILTKTKTEIPILPVGIKANYKVFSKVTIVFGEPTNLNLEKDKKYTNEELNEISYGIIKRIYSLLEEN